jgi:hypothetical protein
MKIEINKLTSHPKNRFIYGHEDNTDLLEKIKTSGWIKPIMITKENNMILSGHRRVEVCRTLGIPEIECELIEETDPTKLLEILMIENQYRVKTNSQLMKESEVYFEIERQKSYQRMMSGVTPETGLTLGRTTEIVSKKIGMGETSFKKVRKVSKHIKDYPEHTWLFENLIDKSIDKSVQMTEKSPEFLDKVLETVSGNTDILIPTIREMENEEMKSKTPLPPGKYGIIIFDFTNRHTGDLLHTDISSICEDDCILLMWVRPHQVNSGLDISKKWGFRYNTCLVWNKDLESDITLNCELLLVSIKGSPTNVFKRHEEINEKPSFIERLIEQGYPDLSKVEIFVNDGWKIW